MTETTVCHLTIAVRNPADGRAVGEVPNETPEAVAVVNFTKQIKGLLYGGMNPRASMPMLLSMYQNGKLKLDERVTGRYQRDQINEASTDLCDGKNIRGIIEFAS